MSLKPESNKNDEKSYPLLRKDNYEADENDVNNYNYDGQNEPRYVQQESVDPFPIPEKPITATYNKKYMTNIKTNPHMRLTQV